MSRRLICGLLCLVSALLAQSGRPRLGGEDWVALFNGKDFTGWTKVGNEHWDVENSVIHGRAVTKDYGYLQTKANFKDFHLSLRFKCVGQGNSGVLFHFDSSSGEPELMPGFQFEVACSFGRHTGGIYGDGRNWIVWPAPVNELALRRGEWNDFLLTVEGNRYRSRLNGVMMVDFTDPKPKALDGAIAFQLHAGADCDMYFKDVYIRDLSKR